MQQKIAMWYFLPDSPNLTPKPFQRSPLYFLDPGTTAKHDAHYIVTIMAFAQSIISPNRKVSLNQHIIWWKVASCDTIVISRIGFRHDYCK